MGNASRSSPASLLGPSERRNRSREPSFSCGMRRAEDWTVAMGGLLGEVAGVVHRAGREIASIVGARLLAG